MMMLSATASAAAAALPRLMIFAALRHLRYARFDWRRHAASPMPCALCRCFIDATPLYRQRRHMVFHTLRLFEFYDASRC